MIFGLSFNIRRKIIAGIVAAFVCLGLLGGISLTNLLEIERVIALIAAGRDVESDVLEMRRYEKNFILYGDRSDLAENLGYADKALEAAGRMRDFDERELPAAPRRRLDELERLLAEYRDVVQRLDKTGRSSDVEAALRDKGKTLVDAAGGLIGDLRARMASIVSTLKRQLLASVFGATAFGLLLLWFVGRKIIRGLAALERSALAVAAGTFNPTPVDGPIDEVGRVAEAFNRMIVELDLRQERLLQEKKLASLGVLTSGIAHQLNNPLNNISTSCQILLEEYETADPAFVRKLLSAVDAEARRAGEIVRGLLDFARQTEFSLAPTSIRELVADCVRLAQAQTPAGVRIENTVPPDLVVPIDKSRMREALLNLIVNGVQASTPPGRVGVDAVLDEVAGQAVITIADSGSGVRKEHLGKIFDPFFTTKGEGKGTGLGLSIAFGVVKKHGGRIGVDSRDGVGTTFTVRLPLTPPEEAAAR